MAVNYRVDTTRSIGPLSLLSSPVLGDVLQLRNPLRGSRLAALIENLDHSNEKIRFQAAAALGELGPKAEPAVAKLVQRLGDPVMKVRFFAAQTLGNIGAAPERCAPELLRLIAREKSYTDNNPSYAAFRALIKFGVSSPKVVIPLLLSELSSDSEFIQRGAAECLLKIGERERLALTRYLTRAMRTQNERLRKQAKMLSNQMAELLPDELGDLFVEAVGD